MAAEEAVADASTWASGTALTDFMQEVSTENQHSRRRPRFQQACGCAHAGLVIGHA
jgi:hypothetical protein